MYKRQVEHLGYVQIDTIHVVERCHHQILYTRIPDYRREHLHRAQSVDDVDRVDLHVAQVLDRGVYGLRPVSERRGFVQPLRAQPEAPGLRRLQGSLMGLWSCE